MRGRVGRTAHPRRRRPARLQQPWRLRREPRRL